MISEANPVRPKDALDTMSIGDTDRIMFDGQAGVRSMLYSNFRTQLLGNATGGFVYKGTVAGNAVPNTSAAAGDYYTIISAGTSQSITWGIGDTAIYRGTSGQWNKISSALRPVNVRDFGAVLDGVTDDTAAWGLAKAACVTGGTLFGPEGTSIINSFVVDKDISILLTNATVLKHKANATGPMIKYTVPASGFFEGGVIDGNGANQACTGTADVNSWFSCLHTNTSTAFTVRDVTFQNFCLSGLRDTASTGRLRVSRCNFRNGREHTNGAASGTLGFQSSGINVSVQVQDARPHISVSDCFFVQDSAPAHTGGAPGGSIITGNDALNCYTSVSYKNNYHLRVGQNYVLNSIGGIDCYEDTSNVIVTGNSFIECYYSPIKLQNLARVICSENIVYNTIGQDGTQGIWFDPHQRAQTTGTNEPAIISGNIIIGRGTGVGSTGEGIRVHGNAAVGRKAIIKGNHIESCGHGIEIGGAVGFEGPVSIDGNTIFSCTGNGVNLIRVSKEVRIVNNHISSSIGILGTTGINAMNLYIGGNYVEATTSGSFSLCIRGAAKVHVYSGNWKNDGFGTNVNFQADLVPNKIGELLFSGNNILINGGGASIIYSDILKVVGTDFAVEMTKANRNLIATPSTGLRIYQTDNTPGIRVFSNAAWVKYTETTDP